MAEERKIAMLDSRLDLRVPQPCAEEYRDGFKERMQVYLSGVAGLPMESQCVRSDLRHARKFILSGLRQFFHLERLCLRMDEVQEIRHSGEWVVDLVRDGAGQPADGCKLLTL